jgi:hypothetical protein
MSLFRQIFWFYYDGFSSMTIGKRLWMIILIKLFKIFAIFRLFFFPDFLDRQFEGEQEKEDYVTREKNKLP